MTKANILVQEDAPKEHVEIYQPFLNGSVTKYLVIGSGPVGIRFCIELLKRQTAAFITIFGNEPYQPYNRVQLSSLLAGDIELDEIITKLPSPDQHPNFSHIISAIRKIDHHNKTIIDINDNAYPYDKLIIATGARPHEPNIPGVQQTGVYTFRNLKDAESLYARTSRARHIVVIGGGLLGLESAKALSRLNTKITLVQQGPRLMNRQLDEESSGRLQSIINDLNIRVITNSGVRNILGSGRVEGVVTRDKETILCDTVLLCAGIKSNLEIARTAKIKTAKGILVDDNLQTSAKDVYAIGECCEHRGSTYGLVNPGFEQAAILADNLSEGSSHYVGSLEVSRLKVIGSQICSMGKVCDLGKRPFLHEFKYRNKKSGLYRKIVLHRGKLIGAVAIGEWDESRRIQESYQNSRKIWPWQVANFLINGKVFSNSINDDINLWPKAAVVCQCNNITQGELVDAIDKGHKTVSDLQKCTGAGTVCGSCKPLLAELVGYTGPKEKEKAWKTSLGASVIAAFIALALAFFPALNASDSVLEKGLLEGLWNDKFWKQVSGFSLLGMSVLGLLMSIRKRIVSKRLGEYAYWRVFHIILGVLCVSTLILHTGFHLGSNLNQILMIDFLSIIFLGALTGVVMSLSHKFSPKKAKNIRQFWSWAHIFFTWPLPMLISFHILSVYYF